MKDLNSVKHDQHSLHFLKVGTYINMIRNSGQNNKSLKNSFFLSPEKFVIPEYVVSEITDSI
jgi:hypothetical protein